MLRRIEPEVIICYHTPFPEMEGNIVYVDYELSLWKHEEDVGKAHEGIRIVKRTGCVVFDKGGGSAFGGEWRPSKAEDERFLGEPGEIKGTTLKNGEYYEDVIGKDGRSAYERQWTDHNRAHTGHTIPHDHKIGWDNPSGHPDPGPPINYPDGDYPDLGDFLELFAQEGMEGFVISDAYQSEEKRVIPMDNQSSQQQNPLNFKTISEFKWSMTYHSEVQFLYQGKSYTILPKYPGYNIGEGYRLVGDKPFNVGDGQFVEDIFGSDYDTIDALLNHKFDDSRLREIITRVEVTERTI